MKEQGPFDRLLQTDSRRDRTTVFVIGAIVVLGLILIILVLPPISILSGNGNGAAPAGPGGISSRVRGDAPKPPEGWEALSSLYEISRPEGVQGPATLSVNLNSRVEDGRNLALYTFEEGAWQRVGSATLAADGESVRGEVNALPANVAVLRRLGASIQVAGWLPPERELDPEAVSSLSMINTLDFSPGPDGLLLGGPRPRPPAEGLFLPTVRALAPPESDAVNAILASAELTAVHAGDIVRVIEENDLDGIDIDYRAVDPALGAEFSQFITTLAEQLHIGGRKITLTLPLPGREAAGFDTGAYDWPAIASAVDAIKLAPEVDQSLYYERMEEALAFITEQVDSSRVFLVVSPFSHEKGGEGITSITLGQALGLASALVLREGGEINPGQSVTIVGPNIYLDEGASGVRWDDEALAVTFSYPGEGGARTVWIENAFSTAFKLDLARRYNLGGIAVEDISLGTGESGIWEPIRELVDSGKVGLIKPNGSLLKPYWEASAGTLDGGTKGAVVWSAPADAGIYEVTLVVSDGVVRVGQRLAITVGVAPQEEGSEGGTGGP